MRAPGQNYVFGASRGDGGDMPAQFGGDGFAVDNVRIRHPALLSHLVTGEIYTGSERTCRQYAAGRLVRRERRRDDDAATDAAIDRARRLYDGAGRL